MKKVGTLKEIGAKVGDIVRESHWTPQKVISYSPSQDEPWALQRLATGETYTWYGDSEHWSIVKHAETGPVRDVVKKEIVPGQYGVLEVTNHGDGNIGFFVNGYFDRDELDTLISNLQSIREAM